MPNWTGKRVQVQYSRTNEPAFLKKFKEKVGFKEDHGLSEKFAEMPESTTADTEDRDDEEPQIVQLEPGDISKDEFEKLTDKPDKSDAPPKEKEESGGKVIFRKPNSKRSSTDTGLKCGTKRSKSDTSLEPKSASKEKKSEKQNRKLLSFGDEDEDE